MHSRGSGGRARFSQHLARAGLARGLRSSGQSVSSRIQLALTVKSCAEGGAERPRTPTARQRKRRHKLWPAPQACLGKNRRQKRCQRAICVQSENNRKYQEIRRPSRGHFFSKSNSGRGSLGGSCMCSCKEPASSSTSSGYYKPKKAQA